MRLPSLAAALALAGALAAAGCSVGGHVEGTLTYPPPRQPAQAPLPQPRQGPPPAPSSPPGIYVLHTEEAGLEHCTYLGERETGAKASVHRPAAEAQRRDALLDLAQEARIMGGNVVMLPSLAEAYRSGRVVGRIYRCDEARRAAIYRRAASAQQLTVLP